MPIGTSHDLQVGQLTYAIGNPFGLDQSITTDIVSALGRRIEGANGRPIQGVIQTSGRSTPATPAAPCWIAGLVDRHEHGDPQSVGHLRRHRFRHPRGRNQPSGTAIDPARQSRSDPGSAWESPRTSWCNNSASTRAC